MLLSEAGKQTWPEIIVVLVQEFYVAAMFPHGKNIHASGPRF